MRARPVPVRSALAALALLAAALPASAQQFEALQQDARFRAPAPTALAMGDAVAAVPRPETAAFANPAHLTASPALRLTVLGATAGAGGNAYETYRFYRDELAPEIERGFDDLTPDDRQRLRELYAEALDVGARPKTVRAQGQILAVQAQAGPVAVGTGIYGHSISRGQLVDMGAGSPFLDMYAQADLLVPVSVAMDIPNTPLAVGATATWGQRRITAKADLVESLDGDGEKLYLLSGTGVSFAAGVVAQDVGLPGLDLGAAVTDLSSGVDLTFDRSWAISGSDNAPDDQAEIARLEARFAERENAPVLRMGAAYSLPLPALSPVRDVTLAADWISGSTSEFEQAPETGFRVGAQAEVLGFLELRGGLAQGYPTAGVGLNLKFLRLDYATYSVEDGRTLGQLERRNHVVQVRLGVL